jgi:hypothetical protein
MVLLCKSKEECWCRRGEGDVVYKYGFGVCLVSGVSILCLLWVKVRAH